MIKKIGWQLIPVGLFVVLGIFLFRGLFLEPQHLPSVQIGKKLPDFTLPQLLNPKRFLSAAQLRHKVSLLNVWASWCEACVEEQAFLLQLASQGLAIYGLNYKDNPTSARQWLAQWGNPYQAIAQDIEGRVAIDLGVYGTPETFVIDKEGIIRYRHAGIVTQEVWLKAMLPLIKQLEQDS